MALKSRWFGGRLDLRPCRTVPLLGVLTAGTQDHTTEQHDPLTRRVVGERMAVASRWFDGLTFPRISGQL